MAANPSPSRALVAFLVLAAHAIVLPARATLAAPPPAPPPAPASGTPPGPPAPARSASPRAVPPFVLALERAPFASTSPADAPDDWLLAFVDVETTGLVPAYHEMIDIGLVLTDLDGNEKDSLFTRIRVEHPERLSPGAKAVNGFDPARWKELGAVPPREAAARLTAFRERAAAGKNVLMVAFNSQFDAAFLDHLFRRAGGSWRRLFHYFVLDVPSMAWSLGLRDLTNGALAARLGVADEPRVAEDHTGLTGAKLNARIYRALLARGAAPPADGASRSAREFRSGEMR